MKTLAFALVGLAVTSAFGQARVICRLLPGTNAASIAALGQVDLVDAATGSPFFLMRTRNNELAHVAALRLIATPGVVWAEEDDDLECPENNGAKGASVGVIGDRIDLYTRNWRWLNQIKFVRSRAYTPGRPVRIAILDTGLARSQTALWAKVVLSVNFVERGARAYDQPLRTDSNQNGKRDEGTGHGTFVAGVIDQVAPSCDLLIARIADSDGRSNAWNLIQGMVFAKRNRAEVVNISLGSVDRIVALGDVAEWMEDQGILIVAPVGNRNLREIMFPANYSSCISVAGVEGSDRKSPFSNFENGVDASAPASGISSQYFDGNMGVWAGTSFAAPMVAAAVADCLRRRGPANPWDLKDAVRDNGDDLDVKNPAYARQLGQRLNITKLNTAILALPPRNQP